MSDTWDNGRSDVWTVVGSDRRRRRLPIQLSTCTCLLCMEQNENPPKRSVFRKKPYSLCPCLPRGCIFWPLLPVTCSDDTSIKCFVTVMNSFFFFFNSLSEPLAAPRKPVIYEPNRGANLLQPCRCSTEQMSFPYHYLIRRDDMSNVWRVHSPVIFFQK